MFYLNGLIKLKSKIKERLSIFAEEKLRNEVFIRNLNKTNKALKLKIAGYFYLRVFINELISF